MTFTWLFLIILSLTCSTENRCSPTSFYKNCWIRRFPGIFIDIDESQRRGAQLLKFYPEETALKCSRSCCLTRNFSCNLAVFHYDAVQESVNCFHLHCPTLESCVLRRRNNVILYNVTKGVDPDLLVFGKYFTSNVRVLPHLSSRLNTTEPLASDKRQFNRPPAAPALPLTPAPTARPTAARTTTPETPSPTASTARPSTPASTPETPSTTASTTPSTTASTTEPSTEPSTTASTAIAFHNIIHGRDTQHNRLHNSLNSRAFHNKHTHTRDTQPYRIHHRAFYIHSRVFHSITHSKAFLRDDICGRAFHNQGIYSPTDATARTPSITLVTWTTSSHPPSSSGSSTAPPYSHSAIQITTTAPLTTGPYPVIAVPANLEGSKQYPNDTKGYVSRNHTAGEGGGAREGEGKGEGSGDDPGELTPVWHLAVKTLLVPVLVCVAALLACCCTVLMAVCLRCKRKGRYRTSWRNGRVSMRLIKYVIVRESS
ncbi:MANSC domain-containing protein 4-like [Megalops cyprinoides]|uniref:MANSC domain-containing protein 4-like n=1 Tax=Megalops cyprinoides TaxID=118141 RepID=UPI001864D890|nr:MANSC domain-containing protein 4-like [Megalops cyprinoides]